MHTFSVGPGLNESVIAKNPPIYFFLILFKYIKQLQILFVAKISAQRVDDELKPAPLEEKGTENNEIYKTPILIVPGIKQNLYDTSFIMIKVKFISKSNTGGIHFAV